MAASPILHSDVEDCAEAVLREVGKHVVLAIPVGIGKPNHFVNALYRRARSDPSIRLEIFTALTLEKPEPSGELARRFLEPIVDRLYAGYPDLDYALDRRHGRLPNNVTVCEFFLLTGQLLRSAGAQQSYLSSNYTHVVRDLLDRGVNVIAQIIATAGGADGPPYSLSCNPDITPDLLPALEARKRRGHGIAVVGQVNRNLPFMAGDAAVGEEIFDHVIDDPACDFPLFAVPRQAVTLRDYAAGLHLSTLIKDGGTIQIGIGSIGDALTYALMLRHQDNAVYRRLLRDLSPGAASDGSGIFLDPFDRGLYAASEMFVEGFLDLYHAGILKRPASQRGGPDNPDGPDHDAVLHAAFFLGGASFHEALRRLDETDRSRLRMMAVSFVNDLYGEEALKRVQRSHARFINNAMIATLLGAVASDTLEGGRVVSGVGGQYNFVAMAHALADARSIITLNSTRDGAAGVSSNIVWEYPQTTIPRHLRDLVVTEYGVADLRGQTDRDVIAAMLGVADSRFQGRLLSAAQGAGKLERGYRLPELARANTPERLARALAPYQADGYFPPLPFGSDLTEEEVALGAALERLRRALSRRLRVATVIAAAAVQAPPDPHEAELLARLDLREASTLRELVLRRLVLWALRAG